MTRRLTQIAAVVAAVTLAQAAEVEHTVRIATPALRQELPTIAQRVAFVREATIEETTGILTLRGTQEQIDLAAWLAAELDHARPGTLEYRSGAPRAIGTAIYHATHPADVRAIIELATVVRSTLQIRQMYTVAPTKAIVMQGTPDQLAGADWLFRRLDRPTSSIGDKTGEEEILHVDKLGDPKDTVRVFHFAGRHRADQILTAAIRTSFHLRSVFLYPPTRAIVVRSTPEQLVKVEAMIPQIDEPTP